MMNNPTTKKVNRWPYIIFFFLIIIIFVSVFSGCISQPVPSETSVPTVIPTVIPTVTLTVTPTVIPTAIPTHAGRVEASISLESSAENITIYVPVLLDENKTVLKMYDTPVITGNVKTAIVDTEHGKALKISGSGLGIKIDMNEDHGKQISDDEFFSGFTISMSNYTYPKHFTTMFSESPTEIDEWVYSDSEIEKVSFSFDLDPRTGIYSGIILDIRTQGWVHLRKGWQVVNLSLGRIAWDAAVPAP